MPKIVSWPFFGKAPFGTDSHTAFRSGRDIEGWMCTDQRRRLMARFV